MKQIRPGKFWLVGVLAAMCVFVPILFHEGLIYFMRRSISQVVEHLDVEARKNLNAIPTAISLAKTIDPEAITIEMDNAVFVVPKPMSRSDGPTMIQLFYPGYKVLLRHPFSTNAEDSLANALKFNSYYLEESTAFGTRFLDDIPRLKTADEFKKTTVLMELKMQITACQLSKKVCEKPSDSR